MSKTYTLPSLVEIFWWDHYSIGDDWFDQDYKHQPCILSAVGYLVDQNEYYYWVASTFEVATGSYSAGTAVLKNCVTAMNTLNPERLVNWDGIDVKAITTPPKRKTPQ